ncbi:MAG: sigma-70 family RNA polymerase sigma factor [Acidimicrobiia bacterium]
MTPAQAVRPNVEDLWRQFEVSLRTFVRRRIADPHRADDVVSEVFLRIQKSVHTVEDDERLASWVFTVARNAVTDEYRRAGRRREVLVAEPIDELNDVRASGADDGDALAELASCIRPLLQYLPERHRRAVDLADLQGVSQKEAAVQEGISVSGMKSRVQRGRRELRALLEECCSFTLDARGLPVEYTPDEHCGCGSNVSADGSGGSTS